MGQPGNVRLPAPFTSMPSQISKIPRQLSSAGQKWNALRAAVKPPSSNLWLPGLSTPPARGVFLAGSWVRRSTEEVG